MEMWLNNGNDKIRFPILPSSFKITASNQNTSENVHRKGEVNLLGERNLKTVEVSSFFPAHEYPFAQYQGYSTNPYSYVQKIEKWKDNKVTPVFIITGVFDKTVSIESFEYGEEDSTGDVMFTLSLKEYSTVSYSKPKKKTSNGKKVTQKASSKKRSTKKSSKKIIKYTIKKGDNLLKIAKKTTGKSSNWKSIYKKNKKVIESAARKHKRKSSSNGRYIYQGTKLVIER